MSAPYRITRPDRGATLVATNAQENFRSYLDKLMKMIPGEVVGLYLVGSGFINKDERLTILVWSVLCLFGVVLTKAYGTADPVNAKPPDWTHVLISSIAFVIWVYTMGGPFASYNIASPRIGSLLVLAWTFFVPFFYKGVD